MRPETLPAWVERLETGYGRVYLRVSEMYDEPVEVIVDVSKSGGGVRAKTEAIGRLITKLLQYDCDVREIADELIGITDDCPQATRHGLNLSVPDAIGQALKRRYCGGK